MRSAILESSMEELSDRSTNSTTIVIGEGPAGLAVGACLTQANISCIIREQDDKVGSARHRHYDRRHYILINGMPFSSGREPNLPGLYFCGYHVAPTGMLREIGIEEKQIGASIVRKKM